MKLTRVLPLMACLLLAACGGGESADEASVQVEKAKTYQWKLVTTWPKNYPGLGMAAENFAVMVDKMSAGRLKVKVYGATQLVPALEVFDAVSQGTAEMGHGAAYYWKGKTPTSPLFTSVPFGLNAQEMNGWLHYGGGMELWRELYEPFNLVPLAAGNTGVQMAGWFNREINSLEDLKGLKMRIPGLGGEVMSRVGVEAVNIPGGELYTSMQTGVIDATEWVGPYNDLAFGFHQVAKYYYYPGWHEPGPTLELIVNKPAYESLPADLQAIVEAAARAVNQDMLDDYTARNNAALNELVNTHGVELRQLPDDVLAELNRVTDQVLDEIAESDPMFKKVYASQKAFKTEAMQYHKISEEAYYRARELK
ncbi:TRAP transporter substrate-binding protein [Porticoccus litoralis]|uniref:TRAP transporter substrate-binding protein n=1 Tax=Porticoccus litoralis TaxID=434086 RepID=A0AAW8B4G3_9GAMM|nr:TRAP transporter substrate-binding protein [Porticoccus litoralis]MDP1520777.1 TRAP transporter substrate-binding protein [Porticoccus litoralis]